MIELIRIYHECEGTIEKSVARVTCLSSIGSLVMLNGDPEKRIFLSYPHANNGFLFLLTTIFIYLFILK